MYWRVLGILLVFYHCFSTTGTIEAAVVPSPPWNITCVGLYLPLDVSEQAHKYWASVQQAAHELFIVSEGAQRLHLFGGVAWKGEFHDLANQHLMSEMVHGGNTTLLKTQHPFDTPHLQATSFMPACIPEQEVDVLVVAVGSTDQEQYIFHEWASVQNLPKLVVVTPREEGWTGLWPCVPPIESFYSPYTEFLFVGPSQCDEALHLSKRVFTVETAEQASPHIFVDEPGRHHWDTLSAIRIELGQDAPAPLDEWTNIIQDLARQIRSRVLVLDLERATAIHALRALNEHGMLDGRYLWTATSRWWHDIEEETWLSAQDRLMLKNGWGIVRQPVDMSTLQDNLDTWDAKLKWWEDTDWTNSVDEWVLRTFDVFLQIPRILGVLCPFEPPESLSPKDSALPYPGISLIPPQEESTQPLIIPEEGDQVSAFTFSSHVWNNLTWSWARDTYQTLDLEFIFTFVSDTHSDALFLEEEKEKEKEKSLWYRPELHYSLHKYVPQEAEVPPIRTPPSIASKTVGVVCGMLFLLLSLFSWIGVKLNDTHPVIRATSVPLTYVMLTSSSLICLLPIVAAAQPKHLCILGPVFLSLSALLMTAPLMYKTWRLHRIFNIVLLHSKVPQTKELFTRIGVSTLCVSLFLICWFAFDQPRIEWIRIWQNQVYASPVCTCKHFPFMAWMILSLLPAVYYALQTLYYVYKIRHLERNFNDSVQVSAACYIFFSALILLGVLLHSFRYETDAKFIAVHTLSPLFLLSFPLILLVPRFRMIQSESWVSFYERCYLVEETGDLVVLKQTKKSDHDRNNMNNNNNNNYATQVNVVTTPALSTLPTLPLLDLQTDEGDDEEVHYVFGTGET